MTSNQSDLMGVIFDMDGVLLDTEPVHVAAYEALFSPYDITFSHETFREVALGVPRRDVILTMLGEDLPEEELRELMARKATLVEAILADSRLETLPGIPELLDFLELRGVPVAVATSSKMPSTFLAAAGIEERFSVIVGGDDVENNKPAPDIYVEAASRLHIDVRRGLAIEDSISGARSARAAGLDTWIITAPQSWHLFDDLAEWIFSSAADMRMALDAVYWGDDLDAWEFES